MHIPSSSEFPPEFHLPVYLPTQVCYVFIAVPYLIDKNGGNFEIALLCRRIPCITEQRWLMLVGKYILICKTS